MSKKMKLTNSQISKLESQIDDRLYKLAGKYSQFDVSKYQQPTFNVRIKQNQPNGYSEGFLVGEKGTYIVEIELNTRLPNQDESRHFMKFMGGIEMLGMVKHPKLFEKSFIDGVSAVISLENLALSLNAFPLERVERKIDVPGLSGRHAGD